MDRDLAGIYVRHTQIGGPLMDAAVEDLAVLPRPEVSRLIKAGMDQDESMLRDAPQSPRDIFSEPSATALTARGLVP